MKHKSIFTVLVLLALVLGAISIVAQEDPPIRSGFRLDASV